MHGLPWPELSMGSSAALELCLCGTGSDIVEGRRRWIQVHVEVADRPASLCSNSNSNTGRVSL